ncbi:helix-turn-helix transcriptional regulator [Nocardioides coralli]|uniref:helix-turn-helix transcriptional regulator n=1 Tax=Nocardioides coralli TaxID=2872154 RepID=UPI001CA40497|nr:WYL domain-containing protein [Nocardioides coralli]QZY27670.1 WYL domain-containing protein [Nocardioides coralli]
MAAEKTERLLNLLIMLLIQRRYIAKDRVRALLYPDSSDEAFERMFERDKDDLRSLGVPIEVGQLDAYFDDEPGYRVRSDELQLPDIELSADEAQVIGLASKVWEHARLAEATTGAVRKLTAAGVPIDVGALDLVAPRLNADEPAFDVFWEAVRERRVVEFAYRRPGGEPALRRLQPWGVVRYSGRWYVVGHDLDRDDERVFRLSRVEGEAQAVGEAAAYDVPAGVDIREVARRLVPAPPATVVTLLLRAGTGHSLRRAGELRETGVVGPDGADEWDRVVLDRGGPDVVSAVLAHGADAVLESPPELRSEVVARLRSLVGEPSP